MEIWKDIKNYEGLYQVSSHGRVRSLDRMVTRVDGSSYKLKGRIMKQGRMKSGYLFIMLHNKGKQKIGYIHRLVATAFLNNTENYRCVLHGDGDPANNYKSNLRWGSQKQNMMDKEKHGNTLRGEKNGYSKLSKTNVIEIKTQTNNNPYFGQLKDLAEEHGVAPSHIYNIKHGHVWSHIKLEEL